MRCCTLVLISIDVNALTASEIMTSMTYTIYIFALLIPVFAIPTHFIASSFPAITTYTSLGDSYASGSGAGTNKGSLCSPFSDSYPVQLVKVIGPVRFYGAACGGATTSSVIWDQLSWIGDSDLVTLTVGGNEVDFFGVLNECVYQWAPQGTCDSELMNSRRLIENSRFIESYSKMVKLSLQRIKLKGRLLVTGYATFFNEETTACDGVTFSITDPEQFLTHQLRRELNDLVRMLNHVIRSAAEASGAEYVDIDQMFKGHRFCEEGVSEPNNSRSETWFFNLHYNSGNARKSEVAHQAHSQEVLSAGLGKWYVDIARVFHPTKEGHCGIRDAIVKQLQKP
jgi:GDSL-like Lipase/Acylhydrolase family